MRSGVFMMDAHHYSNELSAIINYGSVKDAYQKFKKKIENLNQEKLIIIYGAGIRGTDLKHFLEMFSIKVNVFFDKKAEQIKQVEDIPVVLPESLVLSDKEKSEAFVFNAVNDGDDVVINNYLMDLGYKRLSSISEWWFFNCWVSKEYLFKMQEKEQFIMDALKLWNDEKSIKTYINNIQCYITREYVHGTRIETEEQYFPKDFKLEKGYGCFVDCGAFTGDTILRVNENIGTINTLIAFEPDLINFEKLTKNISNFKEQIADNLLLYPCGVWSKTEKLKFSNRGGSGSTLAAEGDTVIQCVSLDDALFKIKPTLIKMDIEGAEYNAVKGSKGIIQKYKPDLAICLYHNINHLWDIPLLIEGWDLGYKFYLREYQLYNHETVMYATCTEA